MFEAIKVVFISIAQTLMAISRTSEKTVELVENEVDNLHSYQDIRLTRNKQELQEMRKQLEAL